MHTYLLGIAIGALAACALAQGKETPAAKNDLAEAFVSPPDSTKPRCYWYWNKGQISKEGLTKDLEAMKRVGIGEAYIGIIGGGPTKALSEEWWQMLDHAVREATRIGVDIGLFNCPGWSQSGGPWVKPEQSMRNVVLPEMRLHGPQKYTGKLPVAPGAFQDLAVLAFPAPAQDADTAATQGATVTKTPTAVTFAMPKPFTARSLTVHPTQKIDVTAELQVSDDGTTFRTLRSFSIRRYRLGPNVGPVPLAPICVAFPATTASTFRVSFKVAGDPGELVLSAAARVESLAEKSLMKLCQEPTPPFDFYRWAPQAEPEVPGLAVDPAAVRDISRQMASDGTLTWDVPAGDWIILRTGFVPTGVTNTPAPHEATGLEVDKMNREALKVHFDAYVGKLLARIPAAERTAWKHVVADSYETGSQNWTDGLQADFQKRYGYDPLRFLPVMTGRIVGSASQSDRFLWDLRRLVADRISQDYVGGLRDLCHANGLKMWLENYGHWGFPGEFLQYGGNSDEIGGEFWTGGSLAEVRAASSAAHIYGKNQVFSEAFTGGSAYISTPWSLKRRGDSALCQGINQFVLHVYFHQPWEDRLPGMNANFGTEFNRHNTWFESSKSWIDYLRRCSVLL
ncbi:MAG: glycosyl hydrolase, partial [Verrucomicrobiota bacterium]